MKISQARCRLLETASRLFTARGFSGVGIDEIISRSEIAKATFYRHFPSKEILVETWLEDLHESVEERQEKILASEGSYLEKIATCFDSLEEYMRDNDFRGCPYSNSCAVSNSLDERIRRQIQKHKESRRNFFRTLSLDVTGSREEAEVLGDRIMLLYSGASTESQNLKELWPIEAARSAALDLCRISEKDAAGGIDFRH